MRATVPIWEQAQHERNWLIFTVFEQRLADGRISPKRGKFPTMFNAVRYPHAKESAASYTYQQVQQILSMANVAGMETCYDDRVTGLSYGYLPRPDSLLTFADLDNCRNPATGHIDPWAQDIISLDQTYVEVSTSGTGLRVVMVREEGDAEQSQVEANGCGFMGNPKLAVALTFNHLDGYNVQPAPAPRIKQAVLARRGPVTDVTDRVTHEGDDDVPAALVKAFLEALPNDGPPPPDKPDQPRGLSYDDWRDVGFAVCQSLGHEEGGPLFEAWSRKSLKFDAKAHDREWKGLKPDGRLTFGKLQYLTKKAYGGVLPPHLASMMQERRLAPHLAMLPPARMPVASVASIWGENDPVDLMQPILPPRLPEEAIPAALRPLLDAEAPAMGVPREIMFASCIGATVAALDDRLQIKPHDHRPWLEHPRLWLGMVGDPSVKKTPGLNMAMKPVRRIDRDNSEIDGARLAQWETERKRHNTALKKYTDGKVDEPPEGLPPAHPDTSKILFSDVTTEKLSDVLQYNPRGITLEFDELSGWLGSIDGRNGTAKNRADYLRLYNGGLNKVARVSRGEVNAPNWSASIIGGIQPEALAKAMRDATDDGLLQRFYPFFASRAAQATNAETNPANVHLYNAVINTLAKAKLGTVQLSPEAGTILQSCWDDVYALVSGGTLAGRVSSHLAKFEGGIYRWTLVLHAIEQASFGRQPVDYQVSAHTAQIVADLHLRYFLPNVFTLYDDVLGSGSDSEYVRWIAGYILSKGHTRLALRNLQQDYRAWRSMEDTTKLRVLRYMEDCGWLTPVDMNWLSRNWDVNPAVHTLFAKAAVVERERRAAELAKIKRDVSC